MFTIFQKKMIVILFYNYFHMVSQKYKSYEFFYTVNSVSSGNIFHLHKKLYYFGIKIFSMLYLVLILNFFFECKNYLFF